MMTNVSPGHCYSGQSELAPWAGASTRHHPLHRIGILGSTIQLSGLAFGSISLGPGVGENSSVVLVLGETVFSVPVRELQVDLTHNEQKDKNHNFNKWI